MSSARWDPERLLIGNVRGRALISDWHLIGEWRRDPWKGFDLPEGDWIRTARHRYWLNPSPTKVARVLGEYASHRRAAMPTIPGVHGLSTTLDRPVRRISIDEANQGVKEIAVHDHPEVHRRKRRHHLGIGIIGQLPSVFNDIIDSLTNWLGSVMPVRVPRSWWDD